MIVEPVPTSPRSPIRRLVGAAGIALPLVALVAVTAGGVFGRPAATPSPTRDAAARAPATAPAPTRYPAAIAGAEADFPAVFAGLPVRSVATALEERHEGRLRGLVTLSGYLSVLELPPECTDRYLGPDDGRCDRRAVMADSPETPFLAGTGGFGSARIGPHLHPHVPPGVRLPREVAQTVQTVPARPLAVVVIGRFDDPRADACEPGGWHCGDEFVLERVAWAEGETWPRITILDPGLDPDRYDDAWRQRRHAARMALGTSRLVLASAYLAPETLAALDAAAAERLAAVEESPAAVWYVRGLDLAPGPPGARTGTEVPVIRWVVVDDVSGEMLATGAEPTLP